MHFAVAVHIGCVLLKKLFQFIAVLTYSVVRDYHYRDVRLFAGNDVHHEERHHRHEKYAEAYPHLVVVPEVHELFLAAEHSLFLVLLLYLLFLAGNARFHFHEVELVLRYLAVACRLCFTLTAYAFFLPLFGFSLRFRLPFALLIGELFFVFKIIVGQQLAVFPFGFDFFHIFSFSLFGIIYK